MVLGLAEHLADGLAQDFQLVAEGVFRVDNLVLDLVGLPAVGHLVDIVDILGAFLSSLGINDLLGALVGEEASGIAVGESLKSKLVRFGESLFVHNNMSLQVNILVVTLSARYVELLTYHLLFLRIGVHRSFVVVSTPVMNDFHVPQGDVGTTLGIKELADFLGTCGIDHKSQRSGEGLDMVV